MNIVYNHFSDNTNTVDHFVVNYKRDSINSFEQAKILSLAVGHEVEIKVELNNIELISENKDLIVEGAWVSFSENNFILRVCFYLSQNDKNNFNQKELSVNLSEKDFKKLENFFLMEERCLIG